jgi:hypothetical protein
VLDFLIALESPEIQAELGSHGMSADVIEEGWRLLRDFARHRRLYVPEDRVAQIPALEAWEARWRVVADAALAGRFPAVHRALFAKLGRGQGRMVVASTDVFIDRLRTLRKRRDAESRDAVAILEKRGLGEATLREAEEHIRSLARLRETKAPDPKRQKATSDALWSWYLEWSKISRAVIRDARMLKALGFGRAGRPRQTSARRASRG